MRDLKLWLAHEHYGAQIRAVLTKAGEPYDYTTALGSLAAQMDDHDDEPDESARPFAMVGPVAVVPIMGPMMKPGWVEMYGGTSTERTRARVLSAAADPDVGAIFLLVDSGGGEVPGTDELGEAIASAAAMKPVHAHADDGLMASAAYWAASQASTITASKTSEVGSIGVVAQLADTSEMWKAEGVEWHVVSTGPRKGILAKPEVTDETLAYVAERLAPLHEQFTQTIKRGRGMGIAAVRASADGSVWSGPEAVKRGLVDGIATRSQAFDAVLEIAGKKEEARRAKVRARAVERSTAYEAQRRSVLDGAAAAAAARGAYMEIQMQKQAEAAADKMIGAFREKYGELGSLNGPRMGVAEAVIQMGPAEAVAEALAMLKGANDGKLFVGLDALAPTFTEIICTEMGVAAPEPVVEADPEPAEEPEEEAPDEDEPDAEAED